MIRQRIHLKCETLETCFGFDQLHQSKWSDSFWTSQLRLQNASAFCTNLCKYQGYAEYFGAFRSLQQSVAQMLVKLIFDTILNCSIIFFGIVFLSFVRLPFCRFFSGAVCQMSRNKQQSSISYCKKIYVCCEKLLEKSFFCLEQI